jgi:hypothetical protein
MKNYKSRYLKTQTCSFTDYLLNILFLVEITEPLYSILIKDNEEKTDEEILQMYDYMCYLIEQIRKQQISINYEQN